MAKPLSEHTREELIDIINSMKRQKKFGLVWEEKPEKVAEDCKKKLPVLKEVAEKKIKGPSDEPTNLIIEGDNYHALSVLNYTHAGKIDVIYIDPPYNTGNKDFTYNDNYVDNEDSFRHSKWLSFISKRLNLAKNLLAENGLIFISIDENEYAHLKLLCDQIFNEFNFVNSFIWVSNLKGRQISNYGAALTHEYILVYSKKSTSIDVFKGDVNFLKSKMSSIYKGFDYEIKTDDIGQYVTKNELYNTNSAFNEATRPNLVFDIYYNQKTNKVYCEEVSDMNLHPDCIKIPPKKNNNGINKYHAWRWSRDKVIRESYNLEFLDNRVFTKVRTFNQTIVKDIISGINTSSGTSDLVSIIGKNKFDYPKPVDLIKFIINLYGQNQVILDFFAGSGTTGQAVLELNQEDGGHRQFILCTNNENRIAEEVTYPRVKTVITGKRIDGSKYSDGIPANIRYFKTDFVEKDRSTDATREKIVERSADMIRIREDAFEQIESKSINRYYKSKDVFVAVIFDPFAMKETWGEIEYLNTEKLHTKLYIFSYSRDTTAFTEDIPESEIRWESVPIPESILEVYKRLFGDRK